MISSARTSNDLGGLLDREVGGAGNVRPLAPQECIRVSRSRGSGPRCQTLGRRTMPEAALQTFDGKVNSTR